MKLKKKTNFALVTFSENNQEYRNEIKKVISDKGRKVIHYQ